MCTFFVWQNPGEKARAYSGGALDCLGESLRKLSSVRALGDGPVCWHACVLVARCVDCRRRWWRSPQLIFLKFMGHSWPTSTGSYGGGPARCWGGLDHILGAYSGDCLAESLGKSCRSRGKSWQSPAKCLTSTYKVLVRSWPTLRGFLGDCFGGVPGGSLATSSGGSWPNFGGILGRWRVGVNGVIS